ncbi:hypothetical protein SOPP22_07390 [Shewanella sp. OPT22]|uniref:MarC family protein n=1 Tax=Parashewanella hymeniacidonis TaxID=2807618 RepID=UPI00101F8EF2|nr:MarC family protein [Parashewanella hymeniacidonis]MBM7072886.1 MarC family protein [Parashewanella hymeniacidonis]RYV02877.1 hypothetical protein SOPP22_07390 [Shewanella sp. OPT22]
MLDFNEYIKLTVSLTAITAPMAAAAVYLGISKDFAPKEKRQTIYTACLIYVVILGSFAFWGEQVLSFFSISINTFKIAGGVLLFLSALDMMSPKQSSENHSPENEKASPISLAIVPLGLPLLAGPGTISTIVVYTHMHNSFKHELFMFAVICTAGLIILGLFLLTEKLSHKINGHATLMINRLIGLIVAALGIEFIFAGAIAHIIETTELL